VGHRDEQQQGAALHHRVYSNSQDVEAPTSDGVYQYVPVTRMMLKWTHAQGEWSREGLGKVTWLDAKTYRFGKP
jgi:hypothetical protein